MDSIQLAKQELRRAVRDRKKKRNPKELVDLSASPIAELEALPEFQRASTVLAYWSLPDEVFTHTFMERWSHSKRMLLPVIVNSCLEPRVFTNASELSAEYTHSIMEPKIGLKVDLNEVDIIIVPGMAFDSGGNRLGRGKGYYDRLLKDCNALIVGLCFDFQIFDSIPTSSNDIAMDRVVWGRGT